jgi:hypothetical protein
MLALRFAVIVLRTQPNEGLACDPRSYVEYPMV